MLDSMKHLSIEEMPIQHIHSKTRTTNFATSIWIILDSIHNVIHFLFINVHIVSMSCIVSIVTSRV
jgi:hypothetical protein